MSDIREQIQDVNWRIFEPMNHYYASVKILNDPKNYEQVYVRADNFGDAERRILEHMNKTHGAVEIEEIRAAGKWIE